MKLPCPLCKEPIDFANDTVDILYMGTNVLNDALSKDDFISAIAAVGAMAEALSNGAGMRIHAIVCPAIPHVRDN